MQKKILIFGLGLSGRALIDFYSKKNLPFIVFDDRANPNDHPFTVYDQIKDLPFDELSLIAYSPGIIKTHPLFMEANKRDLPMISEVEVGLKALNRPCMGITGTNGKSTTTLLLAHLLNALNHPALALGNIGIPLTQKVLEITHEEVVLELSSFQIDDLKAPYLKKAFLLNIEEDHLDRYHTFEAYKKSKLSIQNLLVPEGEFFIEKNVFEKYQKEITFKNVTLFDAELEKLYPKYKKELSSLSYHFKLNLAAALKGLESFHLDRDLLLEAAFNFKHLAHRFEHVATHQGIEFINDSKATNLSAVISALQSFHQPVKLIMGGSDKGLDFSKLLPYFMNKVEKIYAIGEVQSQLQEQLGKHIQTETFASLEDAVHSAYKEVSRAKTILLSPATASYDMFKNFEHRGDEFKRIVHQLIGEKV